MNPDTKRGRLVLEGKGGHDMIEAARAFLGAKRRGSEHGSNEVVWRI